METADPSFGASKIIQLSGDGFSTILENNHTSNSSISNPEQAYPLEQVRTLDDPDKLTIERSHESSHSNVSQKKAKHKTRSLYRFYTSFVGWRQWATLIVLQAMFTAVWNLPRKLVAPL